ncbi:MAG: DUF159 family protein [Sphingobium sp.]|jgi:putative SOS response-associated peptidase YedK|nr:MAG: DUF159 family protein [Sphingobium sp.]
MTDQYQMRLPPADLARLFNADLAVSGATDADLLPGGRGLVVREVDGRRVVSDMHWGFPLHPSREALARHPKAKPKPVNKAKGLTRPFWRACAENPANRCLIPVEKFVAEPTRKSGVPSAWFGIPDQPLLVMAGLWRTSEEWGDVYSVAMTEACAEITPVHDRMPVILRPTQWRRWLHGSIDEALDLQQPYGGPVSVETVGG